MKAHLMHRERDFDLEQAPPSNARALTQDLELTTLFNALAVGDPYLLEIARMAIVCGLGNDLDTILYRQNILQDCLRQPDLVRELYALAVEAISREKKVYYGFLSKSPDAVLSRSIEVLQIFVGLLKQLKALAAEHGHRFESDGFTTLFAMIQTELGDDYFARVEQHLRELKFRDGVLISAELGVGNKGAHYLLRQPHDPPQGWLQRLFAPQPSARTLVIADRDESGYRALVELRERGTNQVANALAQSVDHILSFFVRLRAELAFYVGALNLQAQLAQLGQPTCLPVPAAPTARQHTFTGLYDVCLALTLKQAVVGNDLEAGGQTLVIITGANQGGKSTFLRSLGLSQLMMQCGLFVPAESFCANLCDGLFTHYRREEDAAMNSGKLDEELGRLSDLVDQLTPNALVLFNESFAATNEREGSEIARQATCALVENHIQVFFVTHLYEFAHGLYDQKMANAIFLRAARQTDGERTYKIIAGEPLQTSYGADLYARVFGDT